MHHPTLRPLVVLSLLVALAAAALPGCAPACDTAEPSASADNPDTEPTECGGMCNPARCPDGYYFTGRPNCNCLPRPKE